MRRNVKTLMREVIVAGAIGDYVDIMNLSSDISDTRAIMTHEEHFAMLDVLEYRAHELYLENMRTPLKELVLWTHDDMGLEMSADILSCDGIDLEIRLHYVGEMIERKYSYRNPLIVRIVRYLIDMILDDVSRETSEHCEHFGGMFYD